MSSISPKFKITAFFLLDELGRPLIFIEQADDHRHYWIKLSVKDIPEDTYSVTYHLDPTYVESSFEVTNKSDNFAVNITSYGDYEITAKLRTKSYVYETRRGLYDALKESHVNSENSDVTKALE